MTNIYVGGALFPRFVKVPSKSARGWVLTVKILKFYEKLRTV